MLSDCEIEAAPLSPGSSISSGPVDESKPVEELESNTGKLDEDDEERTPVLDEEDGVMIGDDEELEATAPVLDEATEELELERIDDDNPVKGLELDEEALKTGDEDKPVD